MNANFQYTLPNLNSNEESNRDQGFPWQVHQTEAKCTEHLILLIYTAVQLLRKAKCTSYTLLKRCTL